MEYFVAEETLVQYKMYKIGEGMVTNMVEKVL